MTRILRIITSADPASGGPIEGVLRCADVWLAQGHEQDLLTLDPPEEEHLPNYPGKIFALGPPRNRKLLNRYRYAPAMIDWLEAHAGKYNAVVVEGLWRYQSRAVFAALARSKTPYYVFTHGMLDPWFRKQYPLKHIGKQLSWWWAEGPLLKHAKRVLFTTEDEMELAKNAFWPYRAHGAIVGYGTSDVIGDPVIQIAAFRAAVPSLGNKPYLLFLSRIHPKKGCDLLVEAFATIAGDDPDLNLVVAGPDQVGLVEQLRAQTIRLGIADRVHFPGMLRGDAKFGAFRGSEAFVLTSHQENFGVVVAEAMACSKLVLITDKVNIWREVVADRAGLVDTDTIEGATRLLAQFSQMSSAERAAMGASARESFLNRFQVETAARNLINILQIPSVERPTAK